MANRTDRKQSQSHGDISHKARPAQQVDLPAIRAIFNEASLKLSPAISAEDVPALSRSLLVS